MTKLTNETISHIIHNIGLRSRAARTGEKPEHIDDTLIKLVDLNPKHILKKHGDAIIHYSGEKSLRHLLDNHHEHLDPQDMHSVYWNSYGNSKGNKLLNDIEEPHGKYYHLFKKKVFSD